MQASPRTSKNNHFDCAFFIMNGVWDRSLYFLVRMHNDNSYKCYHRLLRIRSPVMSTVKSVIWVWKYMSRRAFFVGFAKAVVRLSVLVRMHSDKVYRCYHARYANEFSRLERTKRTSLLLAYVFVPHDGCSKFALCTANATKLARWPRTTLESLPQRRQEDLCLCVDCTDWFPQRFFLQVGKLRTSTGIAAIYKWEISDHNNSVSILSHPLTTMQEMGINHTQVVGCVGATEQTSMNRHFLRR